MLREIIINVSTEEGYLKGYEYIKKGWQVKEYRKDDQGNRLAVLVG